MRQWTQHFRFPLGPQCKFQFYKSFLDNEISERDSCNLYSIIAI